MFRIGNTLAFRASSGHDCYDAMIRDEGKKNKQKQKQKEGKEQDGGTGVSIC